MNRINQIELFSAIVENLEKQGFKTMVPRQFNAIIAAANSIIAEVETEPVRAYSDMGLRAWLASDDVGMSSAYLASVLGGFSRPYAHPYDADDFQRCVKLLMAVPAFQGKLAEMRGKSKEWDALLDDWLVISALVGRGEYRKATQLIRDAIESAINNTNPKEELPNG